MNKNEKLIYENEKGQNIEFSTVSPFFVTDLNGIDGLNNTIYTSKSMNQDGETYVGSTLESRNVVITGSIRQDKEINRAKLLSILNPKLDGKMTYKNASIEKSIACKIEKAPSISQDRLPNFSVSFICPNPYWTDIIENKEEIALWIGDFGFELEILEDGIEMGHREPSLIVNVLNDGDVKCGMKIEFRALATLTNPSILNVNTQEYIKINKTMVAGEVITVSTGFGNKKVQSYLNGITTNAFNFITDPNITFLQLEPGDNLFRYNADTGIDNLECSIYFTPQYLGV